MLLTLTWACHPEPEPAPPDTPPAPPTECELLGLPAVPFDPSPGGAGLGDLAGDFTVPLTDGTELTWSETTTGCDVALFVLSAPAQGEATDPALWGRDQRLLLDRLPRNTQLFFVPNRDGAVNADLALIQDEMARVLENRDAEEQQWWADRIHYVDRLADRLDGWLGEVLASPGWGVGIDRSQRVRYVGSYADGERFNGSWFDDNLSFVAYEAVYYNFEAEREARLAAQGATVVPVFGGVVASDPSWAGESIEAEVTFPDPAGFDRLELDLGLACVGEGEFGTCPAWDYDVWAWLCDAADPSRCDTVLGHFITPYHREGRWTVDASFALPLLEGGGARKIRFYSQQPYEVSLSARLFDDPAEALRPVASTPLFAGGAFGPAYNDAYVPLEVPIPADASRVRLAVVVTGHGGASPGNCAEFCNTDHHFTVNGTDHVIEAPQAGDQTGCQDAVGSGTVPNQYGTWFYGRNNWCPGREVAPIWLDVTADVVPGEPATLTYAGFWQGAPYPSDGAHINLSSWLVVER